MDDIPRDLVRLAHNEPLTEVQKYLEVQLERVNVLRADIDLKKTEVRHKRRNIRYLRGQITRRKAEAKHA